MYKLLNGTALIQEFSDRPALEDILRDIWGYLD